MADLYKSRMWLKRRYLVEKLDPSAIARMCEVNEKTIRRYIEKFGLKR